MDDDDSDRSSEATQLENLTTAGKRHLHHHDAAAEDSATVNDDVYDDDDDDNDDDDDATDDDQREVSELESSSPMEIVAYSRTCQSETLVSGLAEVPIQYEMRQDELEHLKNQLQGSHQEALAIVIAQAAQAHSASKIQLPGILSSSSELLPPNSNLSRLNSQGEIAVNAVSTRVSEADQKITSDSKSVSTSRTVKTPIDGYNWRKYGQKQVKSPQGSRSYYKCTYTECEAKKIESCDQYNSITKIVYKGQHKHDPPKKVFTRRGKILSASSRGQERKMISTSGSKQNKSSGSVSNGPILVEEMDAPPPKRRVKKSSSTSPGSVLKPPKKPKFVVHAASDIGISADGYRWRKYGQKMVKGNPHPRNYYKCTSAGCPVRKHIEMAVDGSSEVILTYKGVHDHDMPIRTKDQGSPNGLLLTAVSSTSKNNNNSQSKKGETSPPVSTTDPPNGETDKTTDESTRTLASFKTIPC